MPTIKTVSGNPIAITDSASAPLQGLRVLGKTTQETTTGKNLFDPSQVNTLGFSDLITITSLSNCRGYYMPIVAGTTYTVSRRNTSDFNRFRAGFTVDAPADNMKLINNAINRDALTVITTQAPANANYLVLYLSNASETITGEMVQIEVGASATEWEPYTGGIPSPNPDYPQPLASVGDGGTLDVVIPAKNLAYVKYSDTVPAIGNGQDTYAPTAAGWVSGYIAIDGSPIVLSRSDATSAAVAYLLLYDRDKKYIGYAKSSEAGVAVASTSVSGHENARFCRLRIVVVKSVASSVMPQLEYGTEPTAYEPVVTLPLSTPNGLPGIPVSSGGNYTDADGQQWICDEIDLGRGKYVQRVKQDADLSKCAYANRSDASLNFVSVYRLSQNVGRLGKTPLLCSDFKFLPWDTIAGWTSLNVDVVGWYADASYGIAIRRDVVGLTTETDANAIVEAVDKWILEHGIKVDFIMDTPVETPLSAEEIVAYKALKTNHPNTTIMSDEDAWLYAAYIQQQAGFTTYWTDPKTNWKNGDYFNLDPDYERIKNNITYVQELTNKVNARVEIDAMGDYAITEYPLAAFLNTIATNIEKLSKSMFLVTPTAEMPMHVGNGPGWTAEELNDIEGNLLNMYEELNRQCALVPRLDIMLGIGGINFGS